MFQELIGKNYYYLTIDDALKLPKNHIIKTRHRNDYYSADFIEKQRIIKIYDLSMLHEYMNKDWGYYKYITAKLESYGIHYNIINDDGKLFSEKYNGNFNMGYFMTEEIQDIPDVYADINKSYNILDVTIENDIIVPDTYAPSQTQITEIDYDPGDKIDIIKFYRFEDLTLSMWRALSWLPKDYICPVLFDSATCDVSDIYDISNRERLCIRSPYEMGVISRSDIIIESSLYIIQCNRQIKPFYIYGFNYKLLNEIHSYTWNKRRYAILAKEITI